MCREMKVISKELMANYCNLADILFRTPEVFMVKKFVVPLYSFKRTLDLGCGNGFIYNNIFGSPSLYGLDNDEAGDAVISVGLSRTLNLFIGDASEDWDPQISDLDLIFSNCVLEHIPNIEKVVINASKALSQGGYFVFTVPTNQFEEYMVPKFLSIIPLLNAVMLSLAAKRAKMLRHFNQNSVAQWETRLASCGIELIDSYYYHSKISLFWWNACAVLHRLTNGYSSKFLMKIRPYPIFLNRINLSSVGDKSGACVLIVSKKI